MGARVFLGKRLLFLAFLLAVTPATAGGTASPLPPEREAWSQVQSAHFTLFSNAPEKRTLEIAANLERFRAVLSLFHSKFVIDPPRPTLVYIFRNDASYLPYKIRAGGKPTEHSGYFLPRDAANYVTLEAQGAQSASRIVYHEYLHQFIESNLSNVPIWFNEGIAEYYSTFEATDKSAKVGLPLESHVYWLSTHPMIPLKTLFLVDRDSPEYHEGDRMGTFYAESWALVHYLLNGEKDRKLQVGQFVDRVRAGAPLDGAFRDSFQTTYDELQKELEGYVARGRFVYRLAHFSRELEVDASARTAPMRRSEALARLGDLLANVDPDRAAEAELHFQEALRIEPGNAVAHAGLGFLLSLQGRFREAAARYEAAMKLDPDNYLHAYRCVTALLGVSPGPGPAGNGWKVSEADRTRARDLLARSIQLRPGFGEAYARLGESFVETAEPADEGIAALEKAREMLPSRLGVAADLVILYLREGERAKAGDLVEKALVRSGDPRMTQWGRAVLEGYDRAHAPAAGGTVTGEAGPQAPEAQPSTFEERKQKRVKFLEEQLKGATDPRAREVLEEQLRQARESVDEQAQVAAYNDAVARANVGDYGRAIAILEKLLPGIRNEDLLSSTRALLVRLKQDAVKFQKAPK